MMCCDVLRKALEVELLPILALPPLTFPSPLHDPFVRAEMVRFQVPLDIGYVR